MIIKVFGSEREARNEFSDFLDLNNPKFNIDMKKLRVTLEPYGKPQQYWFISGAHAQFQLQGVDVERLTVSDSCINLDERDKWFLDKMCSSVAEVL